MKNYSQLKSILSDMIVFFEEFSKIEQKKLDAVTTNDTDTIEICLKEELAYNMKMKGLEKKRLDELDRLGEDNQSIKLVLANPSNDDEKQLAQVYDNLQTRLEEFRENSKVIKKEIDIKMSSINILLDRLEHYNLKATYNKDAKRNKNDKTKFKSQKV